ncbi:MAG: hypothetical protein R3223_04850 [Longimicrobiales bacterium]|nr:hypothetical protein [Longimicrobiales bacterium]
MTSEAVDAGEGSADGGEASSTGNPLLRGDTVLVSMDEYFIELPDTVPAGSLHFRVRNAGFEEHNFEILRNDTLLWAFDNPLNPAQSGVLDVTLEPGEYAILCTVSGHEGRGMQEVLTVIGNGS